MISTDIAFLSSSFSYMSSAFASGIMSRFIFPNPCVLM